MGPPKRIDNNAAQWHYFFMSGLRLATLEETKSLQGLFIESTRHANQVGHIDRPDQFEEEYFASYIEASELHCFDVDDQLAGVVNLAEEDCPPIVWPETEAQYLYIGKLATADIVRGKHFFQQTMLPDIEKEAIQRGKLGLRLSCLGDNPKLINFYNAAGFDLVGMAGVFSNFYQKHVEVTKFQREI